MFFLGIFVLFHFLLGTYISVSHSLVNLFLLSGSFKFFPYPTCSEICVSSVYLGMSGCCFSLCSTLYSGTPFSLTGNAEKVFSVVIYTWPSSFSLCSLLLALLSD